MFDDDINQPVETLTQTALGAEYLEHFGVKGMRWGVRTSVASTPKSPKMSKTRDTQGHLLTKDDAKWNKKVTNVRKGMSAYNKTADTMNSVVIPKINNDPKYKGVDFTNPKNAKLQTKYHAEYKAAFEKEFNKNLRAVYGDSPSGKYKVRLSSDSESGLWTVDYNELQHSDGDFRFSVVVTRNTLGQILSFEVKDDKLLQSDISENDLKHFGIKGMRWGVRKDDTTSSTGPTEVNVITRSGTSKLQTTGGANLGPSDDAKIAAIAKQKLKTSGAGSLTNQEMQVLVNRMNLEKQISQISTSQKQKNQRRVTGFLSKTGGKALNKAVDVALNIAFQLAVKKIFGDSLKK